MAQWSNRGSEPLTIRCVGGHSVGPYTALEIESLLREADAEYLRKTGLDDRPHYAYGDHVSDPIALLIRMLTFAGWKQAGGPVDMMICPKHMPKDER